jgi:hypothetical protein
MPRLLLEVRILRARLADLRDANFSLRLQSVATVDGPEMALFAGVYG